MKRIKTLLIVLLMALTISSIADTAIIYEIDGQLLWTIVPWDVDCDNFQPAGNGVEVIDCWNFGIDDSNGDGINDLEENAVFESTTYSIETDGNDIYFVDDATDETTLLMTVDNIENLPDEYYVKIYASTTSTDETITILVEATDPFSTGGSKSSIGTVVMKTFKVSELVKNNKENNIIIFPNPAANDLSIYIPTNVIENSANLKFELFDVNGKLVKQVECINDNKVVVNRDDLPIGEYVYRLIDNEKLIDKGVVIFN